MCDEGARTGDRGAGHVALETATRAMGRRGDGESMRLGEEPLAQMPRRNGESESRSEVRDAPKN